MKWGEPKRDKSDFIEDFIKEELEAQPVDPFDRSKEKAPPPRVGPHWEVDDSPPSDFVKDFFKPV
jgi:hypothetical protein